MRVAWAAFVCCGCVSFELQVVDRSGARARAAVIVESWVNEGTEDFRCGLVDEQTRLEVRRLTFWPWSHLAVHAVSADETVTTFIDHGSSAPPPLVFVQLAPSAPRRVAARAKLGRCPGLLERLRPR